MPRYRRAVVTGMGAVSAAGLGVDALEGALTDGRSRIGPIRGFDASPYTSQIAAGGPASLDRENDPRGRGWRFLLPAALEALESSGLGRDRFGGPGSAVIAGTTLGGMDILKDLLDAPEDPRSAFVLPYPDKTVPAVGLGDCPPEGALRGFTSTDRRPIQTIVQGSVYPERAFPALPLDLPNAVVRVPCLAAVG